MSQRAAEAIKNMVIEGELAPGQALPPERELAAMLGISRPSLREAIKALTALNVLQARSGGGTFVTSLDAAVLAEPLSFILRVDETAITHLFEVRRVLEVSAAGLAASRITDDELARLDAHIREAEHVIDTPRSFVACDTGIHDTVVEAVHNPLYTQLYQSIAKPSAESRRRTVASAEVRRAAHADHQALVAALRAREPEAAREAMHAHLSTIEEALRRAGARHAGPPNE
jgi:GntR family transcriptional repressor for pyruvate dehydrogenase complex